MPKLGMEPVRRAALIDATIAEVGSAGSLDVTVGRIARRAGVSSGLAHHYFGGKDDLFIAAMRHVLRVYGNEVRERLKAAETPRGRVAAIVSGAFAPSNFRPDTVAAWLNFYVLALSSPAAGRLLRVYRARLASNLAHALRAAGCESPRAAALRLAALIDGVYLGEGLGAGDPDGARAAATVEAALAEMLAGRGRGGAGQGV